MFELRTGKGQWLRSGNTGTSFLLPLAPVASEAGLAAPAPPPTPMPRMADTPAVEPSVPSASNKAAVAGSVAAVKQASGAEVSGVAAAAAAASAAIAAAVDAAVDEALRDLSWLVRTEDAAEEASALGAVADDLVAAIRSEEPNAERSLMHRFGAAADMLAKHVTNGGADARGRWAALAAAAVWLRLSGLRLLRWNVNYNVRSAHSQPSCAKRMHRRLPAPACLCLAALASGFRCICRLATPPPPLVRSSPVRSVRRWSAWATSWQRCAACKVRKASLHTHAACCSPILKCCNQMPVFATLNLLAVHPGF